MVYDVSSTSDQLDQDEDGPSRRHPVRFGSRRVRGDQILPCMLRREPLRSGF